MLRTTVSRVKKVCSGAFIPRILRGDPCGGQVSCAVVRKTFESTKSTDDGKKDKVASEEDNVEKKSKGTASLDEKSSTKCSRTEEPNIPLTHREKCQRIIDKAFGACEHTEHDAEVTPTYFSHNINLEDTRREIIESERAKLKLKEEVKIQNPLRPPQYNFFKMTRELIKDENHDEIVLSKDSMGKVPPAAQGPNLTDTEDVVKTLNVHMTTTEEPDLTKHSDGIETAEDVAPLLNSYLRIAKEHDEKCLNNPESVENKPLRDDDAETIESVKDERKQYMYEKAIPQEQIHTLLPYSNRTLFDAYSLLREDENQDDIILMDSMTRLPHATCSLTGRQKLLTNVKKVEECVKNLERVENKTLIKIDDEKKHMFINATTAKEEEEQLTQKLETIEETPLVEAQKPKIEGFNVTPRVLGDQPVVNSKSVENYKVYFPRKPILPGSDLDDVAKRCLNCPLGRIDEILLNEMEKSPFTSKTESNAASKALLGDMVVKADELKREPNSKIEEKEIHSESRESAVDNEGPYVIGLTSPRRHPNIETRLPDLNEATEEITLIHPKEDIKPAALTVQAVGQKMENTSPIKTTTLNPHLVTELHVLGIDSIEGTERSTNVVNTKATLSDLNEKDLRKDEQNAQCTKGPAENETTNSKATSFDSQKDASHMLRYERLLQPEYMTQFKGVYNPSYYGTVKASNTAKEELQSKETDRQPIYSSNLSTAYLWSQTQQNAADSKTRYLQQEGETDAIEHGQTPQGQNMAEHVEHDSTANRGFERVPYTNFRYPGHNWENNVDLIPKVNTATPIESHQASYKKEEPQLKPVQAYERVSITDEILREHELDPYYVLACNETCPIAPFSTLSTYNHSDFVDTTETIYMKRNICESLRPKARPMDVKMTTCDNMSSDTHALHDLDVQFEPEVIPEGYTATPEANKPVSATEVKDNLPQLSDQVSLSELLRRVRERSRLECISDLKALRLSAEPTVGKCNRKAPRCPPTAPRSPPLNPVPPPSFGLPMLKRRPPVCKTPKKKGGCKCTACDMDVSCGVQMGKICPEMAYELNEAEVIALRSKADLTEVVADRLHNLGKVMSGVLRRAKSSTETLFARDYDPWAPIPSWPSPQKGGKKKWQPGVPCNYRCPVYPKARASMNPEPPCDMKPCQGFPKRRAFSMLDCFAVSLDDVEVK